MDLKKRKDALQKNKKRWIEEKQIIIEQQKLKEQKKEIKNNNKKPLTMSKIIILFLFINCTLLELFTGYITLVDLNLAKITGMVDFTPIVTLISAVIGQVIGFAIYAVKSTKENTQGGIVYQSMMNDFNEKMEEMEDN